MIVRHVAILLGVALAVAACGSPAISETPAVTAGVEAVNLVDPRYTCNTLPFAPSIFDEPGNAELEDHPSAMALRTFLATPDMDADLLPDHDWYLVGRTDDIAEYIAPVPFDIPFVEVSLAGDGAGGWGVSGWGQCRPTLLLAGGLNNAMWNVEPDAVGATTRSFIAQVTERDCASGVSSEGRIVGPVLEPRADSLLIVFAVRPRPGSIQTCPSNPPTDVRVELTEPLGDRVLLDAWTFPFADPTAPDP